MADGTRIEWTDAICPHCGAYSRRSCEWELMTGQPTEAPCEVDDWEPDPDRLREDRDERRRLEEDDDQ